jgi:hypothetical protein
MRIVSTLAILLAVVLPGCSSSSPPADDAADDGIAEATDGGDADGDGDADPDDGAADDAPAGRPYGDPCTSADDCAGTVCIDTSMDPSFVDGYCSSVFCDVGFPGACGDDAACFDTELYPPLCARLCATDTDCRPPDYVCVGTCIPDDFTSPLDRPGILTGAETAIADFLAAVDDDRMTARVRILAGEDPWTGPTGPVTIRSRATAHPDHALAADYLEAELAAQGWMVERRTFAGDTRLNLVADIPGTDGALAPVLVTAHWDSTASGTTGWDAMADPAPGAVDNGSGVAVALEVATILATTGIAAPVRGVRIVLFDAEEDGLEGSVAYVAALAEDIACVVNADMIGWTTTPTAGRFWYVFDDASRPWAGLGAEAIDLFVPAAVPITTDYGDAGYSDSAAFWAAGRCAVGLSSWPRKLSNHRETDTSAEFEPVFHDISRAAIAVAAAWIYAAAAP